MKMSISWIMLVSILILSCNRFDKNDEKRIFSEIINNKAISNDLKKIDSTYLVYPYYVDYKFSDFLSKDLENHPSRKKIKENVFSKLDVDENLFIEVRKEVNEKYKGLFSKDLDGLSSGNVSPVLFTFSGLSSDLVFVNIYIYGDPISNEKLDEDFDFENDLTSIYSFIVFLDSEKKVVKEVVFDDGRSIERWSSLKTK